MLQDSEGLSKTEQDLKNLKEQLDGTLHVGPLIGKCCTLDQVELLTSLIFIEVDQIDFCVVNVSFICFLSIGKSCCHIYGCNFEHETAKCCCCLVGCSWPREISCSWFIYCWSCCCWVTCLLDIQICSFFYRCTTF